MRKPTFSPTGLKAAAVLALACSASAHSWVERVYRIAPNGTMVGAEGYPRGWLPRNSTDPLWTDSIPQLLLPVSGQSAYSGNEILNKYPKEENPPFPMLEAAAGDHIALMHLENGHTTLPQNQPKKPKNRGTIFFYGTSKPNAQEKLFDVHLVWNKNGTGGDGRGRLLATRAYDDGQCYQPNNGPISLQRASELAPDGAVHDTELACQSDVKLPSDLEPGSVYTMYWYWDWPDLDADHMNVEATKNGIYPWAGTFMRGEKDPHGFTMAAIAKNESYASTIDIKITGDKTQTFAAKELDTNQWVTKQDIYSKAIKEQMENNYQVDIDANGGGGGGGSSSRPAPPTSDAPIAPTSTAGQGNGGAPRVTVTVPVTLPPSTVWKTVYKTVAPEAMMTSSAPPTPPSPSTIIVTMTTHVPAARPPVDGAVQQQPGSTVIKTITTHVPAASPPVNSVIRQPGSTVIMTITTHVPAAGTPTAGAIEQPSSASSYAAATGRSQVTPFLPLPRRNWRFGQH